MSYDLYLIDETDQEVYGSNYTFNVSKMLYRAFAVAGLPDWKTIDGLPAAEARPLVAAAIGHLIQNPDLYTPDNPANGWGSYEGVTRWLTQFWEACYKHPSATVNLDY